MDSFEYITEPPLTKDLDQSNFLLQQFTFDLPCHTQSVQRMVKITTEVSKKVCGRVNQNTEGMLIVKGRSERNK